MNEQKSNFPNRLSLLMAAVLMGIAISPSFAQSSACPFKGSFFIFDRVLPEAQLDRELAQMQECAMKEVPVVSVGLLGSVNGQYQLLPGGLFVGTLGNIQPADNRLETLLRLASTRGMRVKIGSVQTNVPWYEVGWQQPVRDFNNAVANRIVDLYKGYSALSGWYHTQEMELNWLLVDGPNYYGLKWLKDFVSDMKLLDAKAGRTLRVLAAPIFKPAGYGSMPPMTEDQFRQVMNTYLSVTGLKFVAPQDGIGAGIGGPSIGQLSSYFAAARQAADANGVELWSTVEAFTADAGLNSRYKPASFDRLRQQILAEQPYVTGMFVWNCGHHFSKQATYWPVEASRLYLEYMREYGFGPAGYLLPYSYHYFRIYGNTTQPASTWPDPSLLKLRDGTGGGYGAGTSAGGDWVGFRSDVETGGELQLVMDLGATNQSLIKMVRVLFRSEAASWIALPQQMIVEVSSDGVSYLPYGTYLAFPTNSSQFSVFWGEVKGSAAGRFVRVRMPHSGWLMLSEAEVWSNWVYRNQGEGR